MIDRPISRHAAERPDAPAVISPQGPISYRKFNQDIHRAAHHLQGMGAKPGDGVSVAMADGYLHWVMVLGLARLGIASAQSGDLDAKFRVCRAGLEDSRPGLVLAPDVLDHILGGEERNVAPIEVDPDALARISRSSGTTGEVKRVGVSWRRLQMQIDDMVAISGAPQGSWLAATGVELGYGVALSLACWTSGQALILGFGANLVETVRLTRPRLLALVPRQLATLLDKLPGRDPNWSVRVISSGGPVPPQLARRAASFFGPDIRSLYGASESHVVSLADLDSLLEHEGAAGRLLPGVALEIRSEDGRVMPRGELGRVFISGPRIEPGYLDDPERTRDAFRDGWYDSRDLGRMTEDGILILEGRVDDVMNIGGHKILPKWVEDAARLCVGVVDAAAFAAKNRRGMEECCLAVVVGPGFELEKLREALGAQTRILPRLTIFGVAEMPRNDMGKIDRKRLRDLMPVGPKP